MPGKHKGYDMSKLYICEVMEKDEKGRDASWSIDLYRLRDAEDFYDRMARKGIEVKMTCVSSHVRIGI